MRLRVVLAAGLWWLAPTFAATVSEKPDSVVVTIYHEGDVNTTDLISGGSSVQGEGLAFVTERRTIDLPAGPQIIEFRGVAATIVPQTADVHGLPGPTAERNFDYDLLSPGALLQKSVGAPVTLVRTNTKTGKETRARGLLRSGPTGAVVDVDGKIEALGCSGLPERLVFDRVPEGLRDTPTLTLRTLGGEAGRYTITLSYIATGLNWSADYVAKIGGTTLDLTGWLTLANFGETGFGGAPVEVVAGKLMTTGQDIRVVPESRYRTRSCWPTQIDWASHHNLPARRLPPPMNMIAMRAPAPEAMETVAVTGARREIEAQELGDYKLYALPEATDLWARRTKQVQFLDQPSVPFERLYIFNGGENTDEGGQGATTLLRLKNTREGGLGKPLPAGAVSVFSDSETPLLLGGDHMRDVSVGLPVEIKTGQAMAVRVVAMSLDSRRSGKPGHWVYSDAREITVTNGKREPIIFELRQPMYEGFSIRSESERYVVKPEGAVWRFELKPGEHRQIRYTAQSG